MIQKVWRVRVSTQMFDFLSYQTVVVRINLLVFYHKRH